MARIKHIAIAAEDPFVTAEQFKQAFGFEEIKRGDSESAQEVFLTDGTINLAIVCWKRTEEYPNPYPEGYGLNHFGILVDDVEEAERRVREAGGGPQPPPQVDLSVIRDVIFFEKKVMLGGVRLDLSSDGWPTSVAEQLAHERRKAETPTT